MGGKSKQSQRTKNNARPSSSGRSAELLNNAVNLESWKTGGGKMAALFPTLNTPLIDQGLSPEFSVCVKKLNKKDPITKTKHNRLLLKALQELSDLVNNSKTDEVVAVLPSWAHFYKILAVDTDCKVREATQSCHGAIARACGRQLAPALRQVVPAWLQAQYDDHAPAQTHANNSLKATFPENKLPEVISFCKAEVVAHFLDNLLGNVDKTILNRIDSPEERELQQTRLVTSSLQGLRFLCSHVPSAQQDWLRDQLAPLLASGAFWKLAHSQAPQIRSAWFSAMGSVLERWGDGLDPSVYSRLAKTMLNTTNEPPSVTQQLWACLLSLMHSVPDWHKWLDKKDLLTKRILDMLEKGGWGDARRVCDMLLPLLAHLPQDMLTKDFYDAFFNAFYKGLNKKTILSSKSERQYWITSLSECLRYLSIQPHDFVIEVATSVHRTWVKKVLQVDNDSQLRNNLVKHSATNMASLVKYWLKQSKEPSGEKYDQLVRNFWQNIASTVLGQIDQSADAENITKIIDGHILLLQTLKTAFLSESKKPLSIKFDGDVPTQVEKPAPAQETDAASIERYKHNLNDTVQKVCCGYFEFADKKDLTEAVLAPLITILNDFDSKSLYLALAKHFNVTGVYELYDGVLRRWMITDTTRCKPVVDVIFIMLKHLTEEEQDAVLASFEQFPCFAVEWCVSCALCHVQWSVPSVRRWLHSSAVQSVLRALTRRLLRCGCPRARLLLHTCLATHADMMISASTAAGIALEVAAALTALTDDDTGVKREDLDAEHAASVGAHLCTALATQQPLPQEPSYGRLVRGLFQLLVQVPRGSGRLSAETWCEVRSAVHDGVQAMPPAALAALLTDIAALLRSRLDLLVERVSITSIEHMVSLCPVLVAPHTAHQFSLPLLEATEDRAERIVRICALRYDCIAGKLICPVDDNEEIKMIMQEATQESATDFTKEEFVIFANRLLFRAVFLRTMLLAKKNDDESDDQSDHEDESDNETDNTPAETEASEVDTDSKEVENEQDVKTESKKEAKNVKVSERMVNELLSTEYFAEEFCKSIHDFAILKTLNQGYGFWVHHDLILETFEKAKSIIEEIISFTSSEVRLGILERLKDRSMTIGYYWAYAKAHYERYINEGKPTDSDVSLEFDVSNVECLTGNGFFHTLQATMDQRPEMDEQKLQVQFALMMRCLLLAHEVDEEFAGRALAACGSTDLDPVIGFYQTHHDHTVYGKSISSLSWQATLAEAAVSRAVRSTLSLRGWEAAAHHWDFATVGLCELLQALRNEHPNYSSTKANILAVATCELYCFIRSYVERIHAESERRQPQPHVLALVGEWGDVFAPALVRDLYNIAVSLVENASTTISSGTIRTLSAISEAVRSSDWELMDAAHKNNSLSLKRLVECGCSALARPLPPGYHCLAAAVLRPLADPLSRASEESLKVWSAEGSEEGSDRARPELASDWFHEHFSRSLELAAAALGEHVAGEESVETVPGSDAHAVVSGCLLLAEALHQLYCRARGELRHHYILHYRESKYTELLVPIALRLIPAALLSLARQPSNVPLPHGYNDYFQNPPQYKADDPAWWRTGVGAAACRALCTSVGGAGAAGARGWGGAAGRQGRALSRLTAAYVTPTLVKRQFDLLLARKAELEDTEVTVYWSANEAMIVYRVEDRPVELWVKFEADFPLSPPVVSAPTVRPAVNTTWISMYIAYQNGTVLNAVKMWSSSISSKVESSPQCYVCYCRLQPATGHLPQVRCHQCRNRFHTSCLHKWFVSSHKSNCPLCRSNF